MSNELSKKDLDRFWSKVEKTEGCWYWKDYLDKDGYGSFKLKNKMYRAHRISYELATGESLRSMKALHSCDNPSCVRPDHISPGTDADNKKDCKQKGRHRWPVLRGDSNPSAKLTWSEVQAIRTRYANKEVGQKQLAAEYGISRAAISGIITGRRWKTSSH